VLAPAAAGTVLDLDDGFHQRVCFCIFLLRKVFAFPQAAIRCLTVASALVPMAQIKPRSSRPTAVTIFLLSCPWRPVSRIAYAIGVVPSTQSL